MTSKSQLLYKRVLSAFSEFIKENNIINNNIPLFKIAHIDMELGLFNSLKEVFPNTQIKFCYFHFSKAINKYINNNAYENLFNENKNAKLSQINID